MAPAVASAAESPVPTTLNAVADPIERELLVRSVRLGLTRDRSTKAEDADRLVCVRDRYPGSRRVRLRCATNRDWQIAANISLARATEGTTAMSANGLFAREEMLHNGSPFAGDVQSGVLDVSPNLMTDPAGKDESEAANLARIKELRAVFAISKLPDAAATPPQDVVRFAEAFDAVRRSGTDEMAAANAVQASGLGVDAYNGFVTRLEQDEAFRARVNAALKSLEAPLTL